MASPSPDPVWDCSLFPRQKRSSTLLFFVFGNARATVGHGQRQALSWQKLGADVHLAVGCIEQGVIDQIAQHFAQGDAIARNAGAPYIGRNRDSNPVQIQRSDAPASFVNDLGHAHGGVVAGASADE